MLNALEGWDLSTKGRRPRRSGPARHEPGGQRSEETGVRAGGGEGQADTAGRFDNASGDFDELESQGRELRLGEVARFGNRVAHREHQPEGGGVQDEPNLVGAG